MKDGCELVLHTGRAFGAESGPGVRIAVKEILHKLQAVTGVAVEGASAFGGVEEPGVVSRIEGTGKVGHGDSAKGAVLNQFL